MNSFYRGTPYSLNKKLKNLNKFVLRKNHDINILYKNLNDSIPDLTNSFCFLKNRTNALNKSLNKIPIIYSNFITSNSNYNSNSNSRILRTSPNISSNFNNYSYLSPKPVLKPYINTNKNNNIKKTNNILKYKNISQNLFGNNNPKNYNQININYKKISDIYNPFSKYKLNYSRNNSNYKSKNNNVIIKLKKHIKSNYNNKNYSAINMLRDANKFHKLKINSINYGNNNIGNNSEITNNSFKIQIQKLNAKIDEKDKIILNMQGIINETFCKLKQKDKENSLLKSEIFELKSKNNYELNSDNIDTKSNINNNENKKDDKYISNIKGKIKKYKHKKNYYILKNNKNKDKDKNNNIGGNKNNNNRKKENKDPFDDKWEEIRKLNRKLDNLLYRGENKLKKYEDIRKKYKV